MKNIVCLIIRGNMKKNYKKFVCPFVVVCCAIIFLISLIIFFLAFDQSQQLRFEISFPVIGIPMLCFLGTFIFFAPQLTFNDLGIEKRLCGIPLKKYQWEQITDIKIITTNVGAKWLFFSKKNLGNHGIDYCRLHSKTIYLSIDEKKLEEIKGFIPRDKIIREQKSQ